MVTATATTDQKSAPVTHDDVIQVGKALHDKLSFDLKQLHGAHDKAQRESILRQVDSKLDKALDGAIERCDASLGALLDDIEGRLSQALSEYERRFAALVQSCTTSVRDTIASVERRASEIASRCEWQTLQSLEAAQQRCADALTQTQLLLTDAASANERRLQDYKDVFLSWMTEVRGLLTSLPTPKVEVELQAPAPKLVKKTISYDQYGRPQTIEEHEVNDAIDNGAADDAQERHRRELEHGDVSGRFGGH